VTTATAADRRVLVLAPTSRDAAMTRALMASSGMALEFCQGMEGLLEELPEGAAAVLVPEEAVLPPRGEALAALLRAQPPWSDLPVLLMTRPGAESAGLDEVSQQLGNVMLLERPLRVATLTSALRTAIRARGRQYQIRAHLAERAANEAALREADRRKDEFLATLAHELRNPLAPLATALELLKRARADAPTLERVAGVMERQVAHLIRLVDDLLEVSRITRGIIDVRREPLDLVAVVRAAVDTSRPAIDGAGHTLVLDLPDDPVTVSGDAVRLTQVFANLLTNAAKYTDASGHVWLTLRRVGASARVSVRDDGIGIPAGQLESVFDMFTQVDRSTRRAQGGLGIGLTLVRSLVAMHGGRVEARSDGPGRGSEFVVTLPLSEAVRPLDGATRALERLPARRVLIVDDNGDAAQSLAELLGSLGARVRVAGSGPAALAQLSEFAPEAVLLDIGMPGMDGYEVARRIRSDTSRRGTLLIALTGWGQADDCRRAREAGFDHHMVKPPDLERLREWLAH
jgi:signal transduction histidine kinase